MSRSALFTGLFREQAGPDLLTDRLGEDFVRVDVGERAVAGLLTWPALNSILSTHQLGAPRLRLFRDGVQVPVGDYTRRDPAPAGEGSEVLVPDQLYRQLREGASLVLDQVDRLHPPVTEAADDLMRLVHELVQVNLYLVWGGRQGFDTHWDDHDTVIVQLAGSKHWTVHGPGRRYPMKVDNDHGHQAPDEVVWSGTLRPGEIIHVPRGWWHAVRGTGEMSMHLTFGFTRRTGVDWAGWVVEQLYAEELFRRDLPRFGPPERAAQHSEALAEALTKIVARSTPEDFLAARDRRFPRRPEINLPAPVRFEMPADGTAVELTALLEPALETHQGWVGLTVSGRTFRFAEVLAPLLRLLVTERSVTVATLRERAGLDGPVLAEALELLLTQHLVVLRD
jgi:hypothetical protein